MAVSALLGAASKLVIGTVAVDGVVNETHSSTAQVTEHPVESGAKMTDHYRKNPDELSITAIVSRTPIAVGFPGQSAINSVTNLINGSDPVFAAWETLHRYMVDATRIDVVTGKKFYQDMMILSLDDPREVNDWMRFNITLREIQTAFTDSIEAQLKVAKVTSKGVAQKKKSKGKQAAEEVKNETILEGLRESASNLVGGLFG